MIGELGAVVGGILPNLLGQSKQHTGSYRAGFILYAVLAVGVLVVMRSVARSWTRTWVTAGGRAIDTAHAHRAAVVLASETLEDIPAGIAT